MEVLSQEQFDLKKISAALGMEIAQGRAELSLLKEQKEQFIEARRKEAEDAALELSEKGRQALDTAKGYKDELDLFHQDLKNYSLELKQHRERLDVNLESFEKQADEVNQALKKKVKELEKLAIETASDKEVVKRDRETLKRKEKELEAEQKSIDSQRATLTAAFTEGRKKGYI